MSTPAPSPSVEIVDRHPVTSSRKVAEYFGKNHKDVLRSIQEIACSEEFRKRNFAPTFYSVDGPNNSQRKEPEYLLTKDGFFFLVMGFTGAKAASLKEAYIAEFNRMEEEIRRLEQDQLAGGDPVPLPPTPYADSFLKLNAHVFVVDDEDRVEFDRLMKKYFVEEGGIGPSIDEALRLAWTVSPNSGFVEDTRGFRTEIEQARHREKSALARAGSREKSLPPVSGRKPIDPSTLDTPIPEGVLDRRQTYETLLFMRTFTRSPIDRLLLRLEEAGVDVSGARYELSLGRELLSITSTILETVQGQSSLPREAAKAGLSLPKKGGLK